MHHDLRANLYFVMHPAVAWTLLATGMAIAVWSGRLWAREIRRLDRFLADTLGDGAEEGARARTAARTTADSRPPPIRNRDDLIRLQDALTTAITYDEERMHERRPLLRASAGETLERGFGFCGENARTATLLLRAGGVRAHRLYLYGRRWGHVAVEHRWDGGWKLFDAHGDPRTLPKPEELGALDTDDLEAFPNRAKDNPWEASSRLPGVRRIPWLGTPLARLRPPGWLVEIVERPAAIRTLAGLALAALGLMMILFL